MARRTSSVCKVGGCNNVVPEGRGACERCRAKEHQRDVQGRGSAYQRGYGRRHARWRTMVLARYPLCVRCIRRGKVVAATVADHVIPRRAGGSNKLENGQGLCVPCHNVKKAHEQQGQYTDWRQ